MRGQALLDWLASLPVATRDAAVEAHLGLGDAPDSAPGRDLVGYHPSGVPAIVQALIEAPVGRGDVLVDVGCGLGKVALLAALLTEACVRGIELQAPLVERAKEAATRLGVNVDFTIGDAREARLDDGTVFYLYVPFTGAVLEVFLERLRAVARHRPITVVTLGLDLRVPWLTRRASDSFWLEIYDSGKRGSVGTLGRSPAAERIMSGG